MILTVQKKKCLRNTTIFLDERGEFLSWRPCVKKSTVNIILTMKDWIFSLKLGTKQGYLFLVLSFSAVLEDLARPIKQEKEIKRNYFKR
jgi:hypothetical protein